MNSRTESRCPEGEMLRPIRITFCVSSVTSNFP